MRNDWNGLMKILNIEHVRDGKVIWSQQNVYNILHTAGEKFVLDVMFAGESLGSFYYLGLDNRSTLTAADTVDDLLEEPTVNGYLRQSVSSSLFTVELKNSIWRAVSPIVTFNATGGSWGPVRNVFFTDKADDTGTLIASAALSQTTTLSASDSFNVRIGLSLKDCSS